MIWLDGRTRRFERCDPTARRAAAGGGGGGVGHLLAPMPGKILEIAVQPGESFEAHTPIIIMESMKMEMTLSAPSAGRVARVRCVAGELVEMGACLAELEPVTPATESAP
ncbi:MAG: acetyl-CoA carboxylase biotin carboxyl carrier protein subunit [Phycisphaerae bacterium]|nr:acetyl-CoA carboxylase biotin carboxyl carrier protein subunit [Phycisphaerae bacterium]